MVHGFHDGGPPLAAVRLLLDWLTEGIDRALRLRIEGRSVALGPRPKWSLASQSIRVERLERGSIDLILASPPIGELLRPYPLWMQPGLFLGRPDPAQTPIDLFAEAVRDAARGHDDADTLDAPLLSHIASVTGLLDAGAEAVLLGAGPEGAASATLRRQDVPQIVAMSERAPETRRVRLAGELDTVSVSTGAFILMVNGAPLRGVTSQMTSGQARDLLGRRVLAEGDVVYRPSGSPLRFDASWMRLATEHDDVWAHLPTTPRARRVDTPKVAGFADIFEGLEPDDDDDAAVHEGDEHSEPRRA